LSTAISAAGGRLNRLAKMRKLIIQIYEIQTPQEAERMLELGVDHIGSVVASRIDWKQPALRETVRTVQEASAVSSLIPLFNEPDTLAATLEYYRPDIVHFCESLPDPEIDEGLVDRLVELQRSLRGRFPGIRIMRSIPIPQAGAAPSSRALSLAARFEPVSDLFLTDTLLTPAAGKNAAPQPVPGFVGITGKICDWHTAAGLVNQTRLPVILAGGISADNVEEAIRCVHPAGVDSCTLTNAMDREGHPIRFKKDPEKVKRMVATVRSFESQPEPLKRGTHHHVRGK
jgi:phosphoribosylanthranilate isomerase